MIIVAGVLCGKPIKIDCEDTNQVKVICEGIYNYFSPNDETLKIMKDLDILKITE